MPRTHLFDNLMNEMKGNSYTNVQLQKALGEYYDVFSDIKYINRKTGVQASKPYYLKFKL